MSNEQFKDLLIGIFAFVAIIISFFIDIKAGICCLVLFIIAFGLLVYFRSKNVESTADELSVQEKNNEIKKEQFVLPHDLQPLKNDIMSLKAVIVTMERQMAEKQLQYRALQEDITRISSTLQSILLEKREAQERTETQAIPLIIYPQVFYSQGVDSHSPLGFSVNKLYKQSDKCIFVITINNATEATYSFIKSKDVQDAAISMFNPVISESSEYDSIPAHISEIRVVQPGILHLSGEVWHIINKQKIQMA